MAFVKLLALALTNIVLDLANLVTNKISIENYLILLKVSGSGGGGVGGSGYIVIKVSAKLFAGLDNMVIKRIFGRGEQFGAIIP